MSFRLKLLSCFLSLLAAVLGVSLWTVERVERRRAEADTLAGLKSANEVFQEVLAARQRQLQTSLKLLSGDFAFKQAVATADAGTVLSAATNLRARIGSDLLLVADADGMTLADTRRRLRAGISLKGLGVIRSALAEEPASDIHILDGVPTQFSAVPVAAPDLIGVLAAGFTIDDALASSLKRLTGTEVSFLGRSGVFASTLRPAARASLRSALGSLESGKGPRIVSLSGERYLTQLSSQGDEVFVLVARSWDEALEPARELRRLLLFIGVAGVAVTVLLGVLIAERVTSSLSKLAVAAGQIAKGRYDVVLEISSRDEIGRLGDAFMDMARGLVEREKIRSVLHKTVSKEIADALLAKGQIELGGEEKTVTVLFSDIRSFTTISESLKPHELVSQLNAYFIVMARAIELHHGVIDKFIGDAIMALFGAPLGGKDDVPNALRAALAMAAALREHNVERALAGLPPWHNGIGLNTGTVVAGTLGSTDRWSYTVIGDGVNLASRLEGLTKHYGAPIIVSESTRAAAPGFAYRTLDNVIVVGRNEAVQIFEPLAEGPGPSWLPEFEEGLRLYRAKDWEGAKARFERVLSMAPGDGPSLMYLERAATRQLDPLSSGDEPSRMTEK